MHRTRRLIIILQTPQNVMKPKKLIIPLLALVAVLTALVLFLSKAMSVGAAKPQEPTSPFPYHVEGVVFPNDKAGITLAGTLTMPSQEGTFPAVILISGSGPQNRDEELAGHRPFLVLSDHLTKRNRRTAIRRSWCGQINWRLQNSDT